MNTDEIIKKLGIEPLRFYGDSNPLYTRSDLDRIVAEVSAGYEAQIKVLEESLDYVCEGISSARPLAILEEVRKAAKLEGKIEALEEAANWFDTCEYVSHDDKEKGYSSGVVTGYAEDELRRMANELKG